MKKAAILIVVAGVILLVMAGYGYIEYAKMSSQSGLHQGGIDAILEMGDIFGMKSQLSFFEKIQYDSIRNRSTLLIIGALAFVGGIILKKTNDKKNASDATWWTCPKCQKTFPSHVSECPKCGQVKPR